MQHNAGLHGPPVQSQHNMHLMAQQQDMMVPGGNPGMPFHPGDAENGGLNSSAHDQRTRVYRKKKSWCLNLNITIETPELDNKLNESFEIEIGSNQRLKILQQTILSHVKNRELRNLIKNFEKMYIYIEGKEPVARKSKSLAEMGVKDGDNLIVTTEMKLPYNVYTDDESLDGPNINAGFPGDYPQPGGFDMGMGNPVGQQQAPGEGQMIIGQQNNKVGMN